MWKEITVLRHGIIIIAFVIIKGLTVTVAFGDAPDFSDLMNVCQEGGHHKGKPGPEADLFGQCRPWNNRSCCTGATALNIHQMKRKSHYIDFNKCNSIKTLSSSCAKSFIQERCFYECSPNLGPWLFNIVQSSNDSLNIPLCASDCNKWFNSCKNDYVCADTWISSNSGNPNKKLYSKEKSCSLGCKTFREIFFTAEKFCERIWNNWWTYTPVGKPCMKLWFDDVNPNHEVASKKVRSIENHWAIVFPMIQELEMKNYQNFQAALDKKAEGLVQLASRGSTSFGAFWNFMLLVSVVFYRFL